MVTLAELQRRVSATANVDDLLSMERAAVTLLERLTGRYFGEGRLQEEHVTSLDGLTLWLEGPVLEVYSVTERTYHGQVPGTELIQDAEDGFVVRGEKLLRAGGLGFPYLYEVSYLQGWGDYLEGLDDVREAVVQIVKWLHGLGAATTAGARSETLGDYSYTLGENGWRDDLPYVVGVVNTRRRHRA